MSAAGVERNTASATGAIVSAMTTFLVSPSANRGKPVGEVVEPVALRVRELVGDLVVAHDRPGDELREHRDVGDELHRAALRVPAVPVDVHHVGQVVEREERDADRAARAADADRGRPGLGQRVHLVGGEAGVLPDGEDAEVEGDRCDQDGASRRGRCDTGSAVFLLGLDLGTAGVHEDAGGEVDGHAGEQQQDEGSAAPRVEHEARHRQQAVAPAARKHQVEPEDQRQVVPQEGGRSEGQRSSGPSVVSVSRY